MSPDFYLMTITAVVSLITAVITRMQNRKITETHKQVSVNSHSSATPTVLDLISELRDEVRETNGKLERHIEWHLTH